MTALRRIVIVGEDCNAWLAAASLKRAFGRQGLEVIVLVSERPAQAAIGRWTLPSLRGLHSLLGINEVEFVCRTNATFKLASEHRGWQHISSRYLHVHGDIGVQLGGLPFYKYLLFRAVQGQAESPEAYSLGAIAARMGRFARPTRRTPLADSFTYAFHVDETLLTAYLREHAAALGVATRCGQVAEIAYAEDGTITALILGSGEQLAGDFFIDCSGREAVLMSRISSTAWEDWRAWLPNDRALSVRIPAVAEPRPVTETIARSTGWIWRFPLAQSAVAGYVYCSALLSDAQAFDELAQLVSVDDGETAVQRFSQGRRQEFWTRNCLAIGETAVQLEPLLGANLHLAQIGIGMFIELFPVTSSCRLEAIEYNRFMCEQADSLRDFTIAHYRVGTTITGDYWQAIQAAPLPARLQQKLDLYLATSRIHLFDNETFDEVDWAWVLLGSGCVPDQVGVHERSVLARVNGEQVAVLKAQIERLAASMPRHVDFVQQHHKRA